MRRLRFAALTLGAVLASGCATTAQQGPSARALNYDEASAFERGLKSAELPALWQPDSPLFVQPVNKKEACKLPTSQDQMERRNFRAYWDGACKNGYAFGLGRDIAISDTHHLEEITIHNGTSSNLDAPLVTYDFVNTKVFYRSPTGKFPASAWMEEEIQNSAGGFFVMFTTGIIDELGNSSAVRASPLRSNRVLLNDRRNIIYRFTDGAGVPVLDPSAVSFTAETLDPKTNLPGGVAIVAHGNGQVRHLKLNGASPESVVLPVQYVNELSEKLKSTQDAVTAAQPSIERARQIEREYLYLACNGKHVIDGLDRQAATKICNWRGQFKDPYEKSLAKYTSELEALKLKAETAAQQRLEQQQFDAQQRQLQQLQSQVELQQFSNALNQFSQQMQNSNQQMLNNVRSQPTPQVNFAPYTPSGSNQIRCINTGPVTNCRY